MKFNKKTGKTPVETIKNLNTETKAFIVLLVIMAVYYGWRMFALTPWYDELYTYYCFISKGPVYSAIHWPLPNNHVGYSVLSGFLNYLGNSYIGLRGVSYICALVNLGLIYKISGRYFEKRQALGIVILYLSMGMVNQMAVQGRGYTLGVTCYLVAFWCMIRICEEDKVSKWTYLVYIAALTLGLYTVSSDVYWVVPLCLAGGFFLLIKSIHSGRQDKIGFLKTQDGKRLVKLVVVSMIAAVLTVGLYATIWLAIGSNLLVKDAESIYFGMGHVDMILKAPFDAIRRGMSYMLDT
ncbi:MAG: glycosyltransferase family 39 protein, partial [Lachnospiraceae bacterium]|nr:glycosyltransferase family 39 protein [Lachnospiraceae bacterium]